MIELAAEIEGRGVVAYNAVDGGGDRMIGRLPRRVDAIVTADTIVGDRAVVEQGRSKGIGGVAEAAITFGGDVICMFAYRGTAVVAKGAVTADTGMIEGAVQTDVKKTVRIMTSIAFDRCRHVEFRFTDCHGTVMALAAISEDFQMVDGWEDGEAKRGVTSLAGITGRTVIRRFPPDWKKFVSMAIATVRGQPYVKKRPRRTLTLIGDFDQRYGPLT